MKSSLRFIILVVSVIWLRPNSAFASHISGGDISYECLGNNQYKITLNLFRDCSGIDMSSSETITLESSCGTQTLTANLVNPGGTEISQLCTDQTPNSTCNGGNLPGMERYTYEVVATMPPCSDWVLSWSTCCRNTTVNVPTSSGDGVYIDATMNSALDSCNNSPVFTSQPIPYVCANMQVIYNWGITEVDGDSLTYQLFDARSDAVTPLNYTAPYSATNPINGITIDPFTGQITFTPTTIGNFIVAVLINEYDSAGNLLGTTMRDIQFVVQNCSNTPPQTGQGQIDSLTGTANQTGSFSLELCDGGNFSFNVTIADSNSQDTITLTSNVTSVLPGSSFTVTGTNPTTATISWTAPGGSTFFNYFTVFANDGACPIPGIQSYVYQVSVIPGTVASPDTTILCGAQTAQLGVIGGDNFVWSVVSGDSMIVGTNFSCDSCPNPVASPSVTTFYEVVSDLTSSTCVNRDTIQVKVVPDFTYVKTQNDSAICLQDQVQFTVTPDSTSAFYTYSWTPSGVFDSTSIPNPTATFTTAGTKTVYFEVTTLEGCAKTDSMQVLVSSGQKPIITIFGDTTLCVGDSTQLYALNGCPVPTSCGLSASACPIIPSDITVGTGVSALSNTSYPAPYGNWYMGARHQMLYTAAELNALGFQGGQISALALDVSNVNGTSVYNDFEIKISCTSITSLTTWQTGLVVVFPAQTINITSGWNTHTFANSYDWDGVSNIIVEICFNNQPANYTYNSPTKYTATSFPSVIWYNADLNPTVCTSSFVNSFSPNNTYRPNTKFTVRGGLPSSTFSYTWSPAIWLSDSTVSDPWVNPGNDTSYTVIVYDTIGGCADTASVNLQVVPNFTYTKSQSDTAICLQEQVQFTVTPDTSSPSYTYTWTPGSIINNTTISNPVGTFNSPGTQVVFFEIANNGGCNKTDSMVVQVSPSKAPVVTVTGDTLVCVGDSAQLNAIDNSTGVNCNYILKMYDSFGDGWNGATLNFFADGNLVGSYTFSIGDSSSVSIPVTDGSALSINFTSGSFPNEESYILYDAQGNLLFQDGPNPVEGNNVWTGTANCPGAGFPNHSFAWSPSTWLNNTTIANPVSIPQSDTTYTVIVTDTIGGCADTASVNIYVNNQFNFQKFQSNDSICLNESVQFTLTPDAGPVYTYQWTPGTFLSSSSISNPVAGPMTTAGTYTYVFTISNGCEKTDSMKITVSQGDLPVVTITGDDSICDGSNTQLVATSTGGNSPTYSFDWNNGASLSDSSISNPVANPTASTTYILIVTDVIGKCADTATFTVGVLPIPDAQIAPLTDSVCALDNFMALTATPSGGTWSGTGTTVNGIFSPGLAGIGTHNIIYTVKLPADPAFGCTDKDTLTITVHPNPEVPTAFTDNPYCANSMVDSIVAISSGGNITWYSDSLLTDTFFYGNPIYDIPASADSFAIWVRETSDAGCESNGAYKLTVQVIPNPVASFSATPTQGYVPLDVAFSNTSQPDTNDFMWDFAGLGSSSSANPSFTFNLPGTYAVTLISADSNGCADTTTVTIVVDEDTKLTIPNIFTPNGDGKNDVFKVQYTALSEFHMTIFNRWGSKVYESNDPAQGWDGKDMQGQTAQPGVYFYVIDAKDRNGNSITDDIIKGTVTLVKD